MPSKLPTCLIALLIVAQVTAAAGQAPPPPPAQLPPPTASPTAPPTAAPPTASPTAPPTAPPPTAPPTITADTLLGFLQREAASSGAACALSTTYRVGFRLVIACGASGVWIAQIASDSSLSLVARQSVGGAAVRLFDGGGRLWAEVQGGGAVMIDPNVAAGSIPPPPPPGTTYGSQAAAAPNNSLPSLPPDARSWPDGASATANPRVGGVWSVAGIIRPFLALETLGGGALIDATVGYRANDPFHIWATIQPLGISGGANGPLVPVLAIALASIDTRTFELGLGFGAQSFHNTNQLFDTDMRAVPPGSGFTISQFARLGQVDSVSVSIRSDIVLFRSEFKLSNIFVQGQMPLRGEHALWIVASGGGGSTGYALGEVGLRTRVRGDGGADSLFVTVTVGGASTFSAPICDPSSETHCPFNYTGPLLGVGTEWRL